MNIPDLIDIITLKHPDLKRNDVDASVRTILTGISKALSQGSRVEIRGFGSFQNSLRPPRKGRNPKTGVAVEIPAKLRPSFKAGKELRERVDYEPPNHNV